MSGKTAREERREQRLREEGQAVGQERRQRLLKLGAAAAFLAVVAVIVAVVISQSGGGGGGGGNASQLKDVGLVRRNLAGIPQSGLTLGEPGAKVRLIEFGDLQCPVCKSYAEEVVPSVIESKIRSGAAKFEFRNFTIISEESIPAGAAAIAAGMQGRGWNYVELWYRNQGEERSGYVTDAFMTSVARGAGVPDIARWNRDRKSKAVIAEVKRTTSEAAGLGFNGTPSFAVAGPGVSGLEPFGTPGSAATIEAEINRAG
jgi:protein-disulfide isomerase